MNLNYFESLVAKTSSMIQRWRGRDAAMFDLSKSHASLRLVIFGDNYGENLVLCCIEPEYICGPTAWRNSEIVVRTAKLASGADGATIVDEKNGVRIIAESFEVKENVKL